MAADALDVSVVLPCLDEAVTVERCVRQAVDAIAGAGLRGEVIVADNGSTDGSPELAERAGARVVHVTERGYGAAITAGIAAARADLVVMADADESYDLRDVPRFVATLREGYDLVMGNRFRGGIDPGAMPKLHRYLGNPVLSWVGRVFFRSAVGDFHCGIRGLRRDAAERLDLRTTGMEFASEMVVKAQLRKLRVTEIPVRLAPDGRDRAPHLRSWRDGWRHLRFLLLYSPRWLFLYPGLALMAVGIAVSAWLLPGGRSIGGVGLDVQTLLFAAMAIVIGFQSVVFAVFSKVFAISEGLLPEDPRVTRVFKVVTLEVGLLVGVGLTLAGLAGSLAGFLTWRSRDFGALDASRSLRVVIPSLTALVLGTQTVLASFFLSLLGLRRR